MATELIAAGTTAAVSAEFTLAAGESATLLIKGASGKERPPLRAHFAIQAQDSGGAWRHHADMRGVNGSTVLTAVGTFRVVRPVQAAACGVDKG
jgi:hypothetical protein